MGNKPSHVSLEEVYAMCTEAKIEQIGVSRLLDKFNERFSDGKISKRDLKKIFNDRDQFDRWGESDPNDLVEHLFRVYDKNQDGHIDFREYLLGPHLLKHGTDEQKAHILFAVYDADVTGYVSKRTLNEVLKALHKACGNLNGSAKTDSQIQTIADDVFKRMDIPGTSTILPFYHFWHGFQDPFVREIIDFSAKHPDLVKE